MSKMLSPLGPKLRALDELVSTCPPEIQRSVGELLDVIYRVLLVRDKLTKGHIRIEPMKFIEKFLGNKP